MVPNQADRTIAFRRAYGRPAPPEKVTQEVFEGDARHLRRLLRIKPGERPELQDFGNTGAIVWPQALVMLAGAVLGGYTVAHFAQTLPHQLVRGLIIFVGFGMTAYFLLKAYR